MPTYLFLTNPGKDFSQLECGLWSLKIPTGLPILMFDADVDVESDVDFKVW